MRDLAAIVAASRESQGLAATIDDPTTIARVVAVLRTRGTQQDLEPPALEQVGERTGGPM